MDFELPLEIWILIAEVGPWAWRLLTLAIPNVGRYSLNKNVQRKMMKMFTHLGIHNGLDYYINYYKLPNKDSHREDGPAIIIKLKHSDSLRLQEWFYMGKRQRFPFTNDKPSVIYYYGSKDGLKVNEIFHKNGVIHRENEPAYIKYSTDGKVREQGWFKYGKKCKEIEYEEDGFKEKLYKDGGIICTTNYIYFAGQKIKSWIREQFFCLYFEGRFHRDDDKPARIEYYQPDDDTSSIGAVEIERYYKHGLVHRKDKPALIRYYPPIHGGKVKTEKWTKMGNNHRGNGKPSTIEYYQDGSKAEESWYVYDYFYRENGPAFISYYMGGAISMKTWHGDFVKSGQPYQIEYYEPKGNSNQGTIKEKRWHEEGIGTLFKKYYPSGRLEEERNRYEKISYSEDGATNDYIIFP